MAQAESHTSEELLILLEKIAREQFGVDSFAFLDAVLRSPNARGYIMGAISEIILAERLESLGYKVLRIKEKWVGEKKHHGDLYVSKDERNWFIIESKGLKSNAERWRKISDIRSDREGLTAAMRRRQRGDMGQWWTGLSAERREAILASGAFSKAKILDTHFVSGTAGRSGRRQATPLKTEFHIVSLDLFLRTGKHEFIFATSDDLPASTSDAGHLRQNYLIDIIVPGVDSEPTIAHPWTRDFDLVFAKLRSPVKQSDMQVDTRKPGRREAEELEAEAEQLPPEDMETNDADDPAAET